MVRQRQGIQITELWSRNSWKNFDTYNALTTSNVLGRQPDPDSGLPFSLATQRHIDLRTFTEGSWSASIEPLVWLPTSSAEAHASSPVPRLTSNIHPASAAVNANAPVPSLTASIHPASADVHANAPAPTTD